MKKSLYLLVAFTVATTTALSSLTLAQTAAATVPPTTFDLAALGLLQQQASNCLAHHDADTCGERFYDVEEFAEMLQTYVVYGPSAVSEQDVLHSFFDENDTLKAKNEIVPAALASFKSLNDDQYDRAQKFEFDAREQQVKSKKVAARDRRLKVAFAIGGAALGYFVGVAGLAHKGEAAATALGFLGGLLGYGFEAAKLALERAHTDPIPPATFNTELSLLKR